MTDLEMTKLCAEAMGIQVDVYPKGVAWPSGAVFIADSVYHYDPLHDDAQCMALVKKFRVEIINDISGEWRALVVPGGGVPALTARSADLNRAIVECVAKMQKAKQ